MCKLCDSEEIRIVVDTKEPSDSWIFSTSPAVGMMYCPLCGEKYENKQQATPLPVDRRE